MNVNEESFKYSCMISELYDVLCTYVFCIMKKMFLKQITSKYLLRRWKKDIICPEKLELKYSLSDSSVGCQKMVTDLYYVVAECINLVSHDTEKLLKYFEWKKQKRNLLKENPLEKILVQNVNTLIL